MLHRLDAHLSPAEQFVFGMTALIMCISAVMITVVGVIP